jgi:aquaporin NIP
MSKKLIAEWIGTFTMVFAGTGAVVINELTGSITHMGIAIVFGLVVMALIYTFGHISGAHFNPAVTVAFLVRKEISAKEATLYIITQCAAAVFASVCLMSMFGNVATLGATLPRDSWQQSFILEVILTFILMIVILGSAVHSKAIKPFAGAAIGATVALEAMFAGPISGASMNPARSLGPALISGTLDHLWIYMTATVLGALLAVLIFSRLDDTTQTKT